MELWHHEIFCFFKSIRDVFQGVIREDFDTAS